VTQYFIDTKSRIFYILNYIIYVAMQRVLALKKSLGVAALMQRIIIISSTRLVFAWQILTGASLAFLLPMIVKIVHFQNFEFTKRNISFKHNLTMTCNCQFHQQGNYIHVLIQGKGITADNLDVQIQRRRLTVTLNKRTVVEGLLQGQVDVGNCKVKIHVDYAEIKLRKAHDEEWPQLLLGVPDMMTSLQRAQQQSAMESRAAKPMTVSPDSSPVRSKHLASPKTGLEMSLSNLVHKVGEVFAHEDDMRDDTVVA